MNFTRSLAVQERFHALIPGGAHTFAKGDDQFPEFMPLIIERGQGCHVWDLDGNEFIEYAMGLRAVTLGHAYPPVVEAVTRQLQFGSNYNRPAAIELEAAEAFLSIIQGADMVKFAKNGSDATNAAVKLARAVTGRDLIAICADHPFFSVDDWFIGTTAMSAGIPRAIRDLTVKFNYNDIDSVRTLFEKYPGQIAAVILEPEKSEPPKDHFLHRLQQMCREQGVVFILDEMITGFRWHQSGGQGYHQITPDLSAFGKALGNGFSIAALAGRKEIMQRGGLQHPHERVFLLSLTHGAECHSLAAAIEVMKIYQREPVIDFLWRQGQRLAAGVQKSIAEHHLEGYFEVLGKPCCLVYATRDESKRNSQAFRALFLQETIKRGLLAPSLIVSFSHSDADIDCTVEIIHEALAVYRKALEQGIDKYLVGRPVKPVYRAHN